MINQLASSMKSMQVRLLWLLCLFFCPRISIMWLLSATTWPLTFQDFIISIAFKFPNSLTAVPIVRSFIPREKGDQGWSRGPPIKFISLSIGETSVFWILSVWLSTGLKWQICCNILICLSHWILSSTLKQARLVLLGLTVRHFLVHVPVNNPNN